MGVYIEGMEMPKEPDEMIEIAIFGDGKVVQTGESWKDLENGKCYYTITTPEKFFNAISVPPHGDLIDVQEQICFIMQNCDYDTYDDYNRTFDMLDNALTIIPAEEEKP